MNVCRPVSDMCLLWRACNLAALAFQLFSHTRTYTFIYPPTHPTHPQLHVHQWPRCRLCTSTELLNVQWWRMYPVHGNSSVKLHPTLCVHCLYKPIAVHATMKHLKGQGNLTTLLGHTFRWVWGTITGVHAPGNNIRWTQEVNIPFCQPTMFCSVTLLPFPSRNQATSAWPFDAALRSGVVPDCTWSEGDTMESDETEISTSSVPHQLVHVCTLQNRSCNIPTPESTYITT